MSLHAWDPVAISVVPYQMDLAPSSKACNRAIVPIAFECEPDVEVILRKRYKLMPILHPDAPMLSVALTNPGEFEPVAQLAGVNVCPRLDIQKEPNAVDSAWRPVQDGAKGKLGREGCMRCTG